MGLEDYRVILKPAVEKPIFPGSAFRKPGAYEAEPSPARAAASLQALGFTPAPPAMQIGPARLASPPANEQRLVSRQNLPGAAPGVKPSAYIAEALIRGQDRPAAALESLTMRFAVCQSEGASTHFLRLVKRVCEQLRLEVAEGDRRYAPEAYWAFRLRANERIRQQQETLRGLFEGECEDSAVSVEEAWSRSLRPHAQFMNAEEKARALAAGEPGSLGVPDREETLPRRVARPAPSTKGAPRR